MTQIIQAMQAHREAHGKLPTDILDERGRPLLSWRVALLPYLDQMRLYEQFRLDQPWDSPHNKALIGSIPNTYYHPLQKIAGPTCYLLPRGAGALFPRQGPFSSDGLGRGLPRALLVEVDDGHAVIWTRPADLDYDLSDPGAGLARRWSLDKLPERGGLVGCTDGEVRLVPGALPPDDLRALFEVGLSEVPGVSRPWQVVLFQRPWSTLAVPSLLLALSVLLGALPLATRVLRGKATSPGEWLWLVLAANQLTYLLCLLCLYRGQGWPSLLSQRQECVFWAAPALAAAVCAVVASARSSAPWREVLGGSAILWLVVTYEAAQHPPQHRAAEESLTTAAAPLVLASLSAFLMGLTTLGRARLGKDERRGWHWACSSPVAGLGWSKRVSPLIRRSSANKAIPAGHLPSRRGAFAPKPGPGWPVDRRAWARGARAAGVTAGHGGLAILAPFGYKPTRLPHSGGRRLARSPP
jgi:Protein of unknown function (DUF1559)